MLHFFVEDVAYSVIFMSILGSIHDILVHVDDKLLPVLKYYM